MSITRGNVSFDGPYPIINWDPPYRAAVYAIMMKPEPRSKPDTYRILYFGESSNLSERGFYRSHHKYDCWIKQSGSESNLYIGIHLMPNSTVSERQNVETALIKQYNPVCNAWVVTSNLISAMVPQKKIYERAIVNWPESDRPREKLLKHGAQTLSNAELLAILIRTGVKGSSAVDLGRELLRRFKTLRQMSGVDVAEFRQIKGLSDAKIAQIKAAVELGRRMMSEERALERSIRSSSDVADYLMPLLRDLKHEVFKAVLLDRRNNVLHVVDIDEGDVAKTQPSIRKIMLSAAQGFAAGLIAVHNHPSGDPAPSEQDKLLTRDLVIAGRAMEIRVFDHLIIGDGRYFSFADEGLIEEYEKQAIILGNKES